MRFKTVVLVAALFGAACSSSTSRPAMMPVDGPPSSGSGGSAPGAGGSGGGGSGGQTAAGGSGGGVGVQQPDSSVADASPIPTDAPGPGATDHPPAATGGKALLVVGTIPLVGTDTEFEAAFKAHGLEVEIIQEKLATPKDAEGKRVIMFSYSMSSTAFMAEPFTDVAVPIIVTEHNLLSRIKMASNHGFQQGLTKITVISDHELAGGFPKGDVEVYGRTQEMFWGVPSPAAINVAHITGQPDKMTYFAYDKGAMMDGAVAPAKRVQFFHATHSPDPVDKNLYLNDNGLKLLGVAIDWCLK